MRPLLLLLAGCAIEEADFAREADQAVCRWKSECFPQYGTYSDCLDDATGDWEPPTGACDYDGQTARSCLSGLRQLECPLAGTEPAFPSACDAVWTCD